MKTLTKLIAITALLVTPFMAHAGQTPITTVSTVQMLNTNIWQVVFPTTTTGSPACATQLDRMRFNVATDHGRMAMSMLLLAMAQGKSVKLTGNGTCSGVIEWGNNIIVYN